MRRRSRAYGRDHLEPIESVASVNSDRPRGSSLKPDITRRVDSRLCIKVRKERGVEGLLSA